MIGGALFMDGWNLYDASGSGGNSNPYEYDIFDFDMNDYYRIMAENGYGQNTA